MFGLFKRLDGVPVRLDDLATEVLESSRKVRETRDRLEEVALTQNTMSLALGGIWDEEKEIMLKLVNLDEKVDRLLERMDALAAHPSMDAIQEGIANILSYAGPGGSERS